MASYEGSSEMDAQAARNGWTPNPNHSDARYAEHPQDALKSNAFSKKEGYGGSYKDAMKNKDCP